jgi:hypothetical protein
MDAQQRMKYQKLHGPHPALVMPMPPKCLHPNSNSTWRAKIGPKKKTREASWLITEKYCREVFGKYPKWVDAVVRLEFFFGKQNCKKGGHRRLHDRDNILAWAKNLIDGLQDGGLVEDDCGITYLPPHQEIIDSDEDFVLVIAWEGKLTWPQLGS